jgi:prolycopene isomerase
MGGLTTAAKLIEKGAKVVVLEKYLVPGGSAAHYKRDGYTFDVGSSMMFGFGDKGTTNLITKALESVGKKMKTVPDPTQVHYHCPRSSQFPEVRGRSSCSNKHLDIDLLENCLVRQPASRV